MHDVGVRVHWSYATYLAVLDTIHTLDNQTRVICPNSSCRKINYTRTYGPDLLGVYDIHARWNLSIIT